MVQKVVQVAVEFIYIGIESLCALYFVYATLINLTNSINASWFLPICSMNSTEIIPPPPYGPCSLSKVP